MADADSVRTLIEEIFELRSRITSALGTSPPELLPPAPAELVTEAERQLDFVFPPSYREFLRVCDGFVQFSEGFDLVGVQQMLSAEYARDSKRIRDLAWQGGERVGVEGFIIGLRAGSFRALLLDRTVERDERGELPAAEWEFEPLARGADFRAFLALWRDAARRTLVEAQKLAATKPPKPPDR
jgi:hypothetical protein